MKKYILMASAGLLILVQPVLAETAADRARMDPNQLTNRDEKNTSENVRDRSDDAVLPEDQSNKSEFIDRTAAIRKDITNLADLTTSARNVKIVTLDDGTVVLRGPVNSAAEKSKIEEIARKHSGKDQVKSYLEIAE